MLDENGLPHNPTPTYLEISLDRTLTYQHHLETLRKKLTSRVALIRRLAGTGWGARATSSRITALALVYSTAEYCAPVWNSSAHTHLLDRTFNDALRVVTGCLKSTPTEYLPVLSGIPPAELRRKATTLSLARQSLEPGHALHIYFNRQMSKKRLKSRKPSVVGSKHQCSNMDPQYLKRELDIKHHTSSLFFYRFGTITDRSWTQPVSLVSAELSSHWDRTIWISDRWGLTTTAVCDCGAEQQTAENLLHQRPTYDLARKDGLLVLNDNAIDWLLNVCIFDPLQMIEQRQLKRKKKKEQIQDPYEEEGK